MWVIKEQPNVREKERKRMDTCMQNRTGKNRAEADWEGMRHRGSQCAALHLEEESGEREREKGRDKGRVRK